MASRKTDAAWDACKDVQTPEGAALRSLFDSSPFKVLSNAGVKDQEARDRDVCDAVIEYIADNYLFAVEAHGPFISGSMFTVPEGDASVVGWFTGGGPIDRSGGDTTVMLAMLSQMTDKQRVEAINRICGQYCARCGTLTEGRLCECRDDD